MAFLTYTPELGEKKSEAQIEARLSHYGKHWFLVTPLELKGRGIELQETYTSQMLTPQAQHKIGWHKYKVTERAFQAICEKYSVSSEILL